MGKRIQTWLTSLLSLKHLIARIVVSSAVIMLLQQLFEQLNWALKSILSIGFSNKNSCVVGLSVTGFWIQFDELVLGILSIIMTF